LASTEILGNEASLADSIAPDSALPASNEDVSASRGADDEEGDATHDEDDEDEDDDEDDEDEDEDEDEDDEEKEEETKD